ncbi:MAG: hypothetical protein MMC23_005669 [Stictis urceolatum]|nr:hypothetical protein [Stictis urceolata]
MNTIREIQKLNQRELESVVPPSASWHTDYRDTAYVHIGGLSFDLTEGDIVTIFSQYGEPVWLKLARDKETGKSKGYAWLKYEDQRSCDLAVDNLGGATVLERVLKVDHTRYKKRDDEEEADAAFNISFQREGRDEKSSKKRLGSASESDDERPLLKEEIELAELMRSHDDDDPMKAYLIEEKKEEVSHALARQKKELRRSKGDKHRHRHRDRSKRERIETGRDDNHRHRHRRHYEDRRRVDDKRDETKRIPYQDRDSDDERHRPHKDRDRRDSHRHRD